MNNIPRVLPKEQVFSGSSTCSRERLTLKDKKKSVDWMTDLRSKACKAREPVWDTFAGTLATVKSFL